MPAKKSESLEKRMARIASKRRKKGPKKLKASQAPAAVPPATRERVGETLATRKNADNGRVGSVERPQHLLEFQEILKSDFDLANTFHSVAMVYGLARNSYNRKKNAFDEMPFDEENVRNLMQAIFSEARGELITAKEVRHYLRQRNVPALTVIYRDILGLSPSSSKAEMQEAVSKFSKKMEHFEDLTGYEEQGELTGALTAISNAVEEIDKSSENPGEINEIIEGKKKEIVKEAGLENLEPIIFDRDLIKATLAGHETRAKEAKEAAERAASEPSVTPEAEEAGEPIDFEAFFRDEVAESPEMRAAYMPFYNLYLAFSNPEDKYDQSKARERYFDGDDWNTMAGNISEALDDNDLTQALFDAAGNANEVRKGDPKSPAYKWALIKAVADHYGISDNPEALKSKLIEVSETLTKTYKNIGRRKKK